MSPLAATEPEALKRADVDGADDPAADVDGADVDAPAAAAPAAAADDDHSPKKQKQEELGSDDPAPTSVAADQSPASPAASYPLLLACALHSTPLHSTSVLQELGSKVVTLFRSAGKKPITVDKTALTVASAALATTETDYDRGVPFTKKTQLSSAGSADAPRSTPLPADPASAAAPEASRAELFSQKLVQAGFQFGQLTMNFKNKSAQECTAPAGATVFATTTSTDNTDKEVRQTHGAGRAPAASRNRRQPMACRDP